jgi:hypothetical protein
VHLVRGNRSGPARACRADVSCTSRWSRRPVTAVSRPPEPQSLASLQRVLSCLRCRFVRVAARVADRVSASRTLAPLRGGLRPSLTPSLSRSATCALVGDASQARRAVACAAARPSVADRRGSQAPGSRDPRMMAEQRDRSDSRAPGAWESLRSGSCRSRRRRGPRSDETSGQPGRPAVVVPRQALARLPRPPCGGGGLEPSSTTV